MPRPRANTPNTHLGPRCAHIHNWWSARIHVPAVHGALRFCDEYPKKLSLSPSVACRVRERRTDAQGSEVCVRVGNHKLYIQGIYFFTYLHNHYNCKHLIYVTRFKILSICITCKLLPYVIKKTTPQQVHHMQLFQICHCVCARIDIQSSTTGYDAQYGATQMHTHEYAFPHSERGRRTVCPTITRDPVQL